MLSEEEWTGVALAYAYGQTIPEEEFEVMLEFRQFYHARLNGEAAPPAAW